MSIELKTKEWQLQSCSLNLLGYAAAHGAGKHTRD